MKIEAANTTNMARKKILKGDANFKYLVANNGYFVDKTMLIPEFLENADKVLVMPRPRRFGKTMNLSMIEYFFDISKKEDATLFSEFKINAEKGFCEQHQNRYPVINITLKGVVAENWEGCLRRLKDEIYYLYLKNEYILDSDKISKFDKRTIEKILLKNADEADYTASLKNLSRYLKAHFERDVIILLDEYDTPIINGYRENFYKQIITFMQVFLGSAFKDNPSLHKGLITGIMRIAKESMFSALNNPGIFTITSFNFSDKFGFTEAETKALLEYFGLQNRFGEVQQWYDGYQFGNADRMYNPWSIVSYIARHEEGFKPYWVNTGTDSLIKERILEQDINQTRDSLQQLISGGTIEKALEEEFVFPDFDTDRELLWTLLTFSGYLTQVKKVGGDVFELKIPNYEIATVFKRIIINWLQRGMKIRRELLIETTEHLLGNRITDFEKGFKKIMGDTFSYFDTAGGEPENVYQAYVLGMLAIISDDYLIRSNRESGEGRYDILLIPNNKTKFGIVIEIKQLKRMEKETDEAFNKRINKLLKEAAGQIERNKYYKELLAHHIKKIIKLPIVFAGKVPFVNLLPEGEKES